MNRLKKGFDYFWKLKPSTFRESDVIYPHHWMQMLKTSVDKKDEDLIEEQLSLVAEKIFDNE